MGSILVTHANRAFLDHVNSIEVEVLGLFKFAFQAAYSDLPLSILIIDIQLFLLGNILLRGGIKIPAHDDLMIVDWLAQVTRDRWYRLDLILKVGPLQALDMRLKTSNRLLLVPWLAHMSRLFIFLQEVNLLL